jgi:MFS transporter, PPP family, 3-phenylpropionic acid transporter
VSELVRPDPNPSVVRPAIVYFALFGALGAYFPYIAVFFGSIGLSLPEIGLLSALNAGIAVVAAPTWGAIVDRARDIRAPIVVAGAWSALAAVWLGLSREPAMVAFAVIVLAGGMAGLGPMLDTRTIEIVDSDRDRYGRARAWGSLAFTVAALGVGVVIGKTGPGGLFLLFAPGLALTSVLAYVMFGRRGTSGTGPASRVSARRSSGTFAAGLAGIASDSPLLLFFVGSVLVWSAGAAVTTFVSVHLVQLGADTALVGLVWTPGALVEVPLMLAFPLIARRFPAGRLLVVGALAFALRSAIWASVADPWLFVATAPLSGVGYAFFFVGTVTYVSRAVPSSVQATAQGLFSGTAFSVGQIIGGVVGGQLAAILTIPGLFGAAAATTAVGAGIVFWATELRKSTEPG